MRNVRLFVNNTELDILNREEYDIQIWKQVFNINNLTSRSGEYTRTIKLPTSSTNVKFFNFVNRTDISKPLATGFDARIEIDGLDILIGKLDLIACDLKNQTITCSMYSKSITWASAIGDKSLQELNFTPSIYKGLITAKQINLDLENTNSPFTHNNLHDVIFPIISFGSFFIPNEYNNQPAILNQYYRSANGDFTGQNPVLISDPQFNIFDNDQYILNRYSNAQFKNTDLPPSIYFGNTIRQIFKDANINVQCKLFGEDEFERLIIPPTSNEDGFNWAYLAFAFYDSDLYTYTYAANFIAFPVLPKQIALDNDFFYSQLYTLNVAGNTGFTPTRTVELEQYLGIAGFLVIKLCGFITATTVQNNYTQLPIYPDGSYQVTDFQIQQNRDFNLYYSSPKQGYQRPIEYICPVDGHYTITIEYLVHAILECNPPPPFTGPPAQTSIENDPDLYDAIRRSAIIIRKVTDDGAMGYSDFHILRFGYTYVPYPNVTWPGIFDDTYIGHELINAPNFGTLFFQNNNLTFDAFCKRGERIQIYYVQSLFVNAGTNQYIAGYINNEFHINLVQINYVSPILEIGSTLSAFEQTIFNKKSDVLLHPELFLPNVKQIDFVKEFIKLFNLYASFDDTSNTLVLDTYEDYYLPAKNGVDISHLCDYGEKRVLNENSIRQLIFRWKDDDIDYFFNTQGFNYNLSQVNNNNNSANQVEQVIQLDFFSATAFKDYKIWYATKDALGFFGFLPDALYIYQREVAAVISLPTYSTKETLAQKDNSATPPNFKYAMKLIKVKEITKLSNINFVQPTATEAFPFSATTYRRSGGTPMRVFDPDNRCEIDHWSRSLDSEALDNWQFYIQCDFANSVNVNAWTLNWNGTNGLYQTFWNVLTQIYFNSYAYWINVYLPAKLYKELNSCRKSVFINGDNFIIQEIRGYSVLTEKITQLVLIKR